MESHTLILTTPKILVPDSIDSAYVVDLIENSITEIEYFGVELDNQADYVDDDMKAFNDAKTHIEIHFETSEKIHYHQLTKPDIQSIIIGELNNSQHTEIRANKKDITVNL